MIKHKPENAESLIIDGCQVELDKIVRLDAHRMLQAALETEVADYIAHHKDLVDRQGRRTVRMNGRINERGILSGAG